MKKVEVGIEELGSELNFGEVASMRFHPVGLEALILVLAKEELGFEREDFEEIGAFGSKLSLILKLFSQYFISVEKAVEKAPEIWTSIRRWVEWK